MSTLTVIPLGTANHPVKWRTPKANTLYNRIAEFIATDFTGCSAGTIRNAKLSLQIFELYAGTQPLTPNLINGYAAWLETKRDLKPVSVSDHCQKLRRFLRWAYRMEYSPKDLSLFTARVMVPRTPLPLIFSQSEYERLRDEADGSAQKWAFILAYHTGMDLIDVCFFRWVCVDLTAMVISTVRMKIKRHSEAAICTIPIISGSDLHTALVQLAEERQEQPGGEDWVCPELAAAYSWADCNIHQSFQRFIQRHCKGKSFRTFRRTFISNLANSGMNVAVACRMTAHSKPQTFLRYVRPDADAMRSGLEDAFSYAKNKQKNQSKPES